MSFRPRFMAERFHPLALAIPCLLLLTSGCDDPSANTPKTSNRPKGVVYQVGADNFIPLVLYSERTSLVEFWGPNCEPCIEIEPVIREIAKQNRDIMVAKYNVQIEAGVADRYGVGVIPTFIVFKEGEVQAKLVGYQSKQRLL
ncbi:MAG: thioredoxin family protein, partial [Planctomycetota bacterium]